MTDDKKMELYRFLAETEEALLNAIDGDLFEVQENLRFHIMNVDDEKDAEYWGDDYDRFVRGRSLLNSVYRDVEKRKCELEEEIDLE